MIRQQLFVFALRCIASSFGMWLAINWFSKTPAPTDFVFFLMVGLIFSLINSIVKPLVKVFALPLAIITMGISTIIINVGMIWLTLHFFPEVEMDFWGFLATSFILSVINGVVNLIMPSYNKK